MTTLAIPTPDPGDVSVVDRLFGGDYVTRALARAVEARRAPGTDVDGALSLFVRRARAEDQPVERMLVALKRLLAACLRATAPDEDPAEVTALLLRRAITEYYR